MLAAPVRVAVADQVRQCRLGVALQVWPGCALATAGRFGTAV